MAQMTMAEAQARLQEVQHPISLADQLLARLLTEGVEVELQSIAGLPIKGKLLLKIPVPDDDPPVNPDEQNGN